MTDRKQALMALALLLAAALTVSCTAAKTAGQEAVPTAAAQPAPRTPEPVIEPRALELLKAASERLAAARSMSFTAAVSYEHPSAYGPPVVYAMRYDVSLRRPDRLRIVMPGDGPASEFVYDGREMAAISPSENLAAVAAAPPTIDEALKMAFVAADIHFPFTDLILSDPYAALAEGVKLAFVMGTSDVVGGGRTDVVVWADDEVFLQIWIGAQDKLPRRFRAVYLSDPLRLRHEMELTHWQLDKGSGPAWTARSKYAASRRIEFAKPSALQGMSRKQGGEASGAGSPANAAAKP